MPSPYLTPVQPHHGTPEPLPDHDSCRSLQSDQRYVIDVPGVRDVTPPMQPRPPIPHACGAPPDGPGPYQAQVMSDQQRQVLQTIASSAHADGSSLIGGLALALCLGHRRTGDADLRDTGVFSADTCERSWRAAGAQRVRVVSEGQVGMRQVAADVDGVRVEVSALPKVDDRTIDEPTTGMPVARFDEVVRLKMLALVNRGRKRDFIDAYAIMQVPGYDAERCCTLLHEVESTVRAPTSRSVLVQRLLAAPYRPGYDQHAHIDRVTQPDGTTLPSDETCIRQVQAAFSRIAAD